MLVVDDEQHIVDFVAMGLEGRSMEVKVALDGSAALKDLEEFRPDVVVLDLMLPRLDGWEVLAALQREETLDMVPVVILTASADPHDQERARAARVTDYVVKPLTADRLLEVVERALAAPAPSGR